jgi:predicted CoA-binding protein
LVAAAACKVTSAESAQTFESSPMPTVAILGASADRSKFGNKSVRAHLAQGYTVYPVNPKGGQIEGLSVYRSLAEVPGGKLDRISVYLPPLLVLAALDEMAARGCDELFLNPGTESDEVLAKARALGLDPIQACSIVDLGLRPDEI